MSLSLLTTYDNSITAHLVKTRLENDGIPCFLNNENFTNLMPYYYNMLGCGVRVMVPTDHLERAKVITGVNESKLICPNCTSANIANENNHVMRGLGLLLLVILFIPIGNLINDYTCKDCNHRFKK